MTSVTERNTLLLRADITLAELPGGHATGTSVYCGRHNPKMVADVCTAIRVAYEIE